MAICYAKIFLKKCPLTKLNLKIEHKKMEEYINNVAQSIKKMFSPFFLRFDNRLAIKCQSSTQNVSKMKMCQREDNEADKIQGKPKQR